MYPAGSATAIAFLPAMGPIVVNGCRCGSTISSVSGGTGINSSSSASRTRPPSASGTRPESYEIAPPASHEASPTAISSWKRADANVHLSLEDAHRRTDQIRIAGAVPLDD